MLGCKLCHFFAGSRASVAAYIGCTWLYCQAEEMVQVVGAESTIRKNAYYVTESSWIQKSARGNSNETPVAGSQRGLANPPKNKL